MSESRDEVSRACQNLWIGDQTRHVETVMKVLREVENMRKVEHG
jgi:hypothetical protein